MNRCCGRGTAKPWKSGFQAGALSRKVGEKFVEVPNPFDFGVVETLIVVAVRHHHYGLGIFRHVPAVFVPIIHEETYPEVIDQLSFGLLGTVDDRLADSMPP